MGHTHMTSSFFPTWVPKLPHVTKGGKSQTERQENKGH